MNNLSKCLIITILLNLYQGCGQKYMQEQFEKDEGFISDGEFS